MTTGQANVHITRCEFYGNTASGGNGGGGMLLWLKDSATASLSVASCTFALNVDESQHGGGALHVYSEAPTDVHVLMQDSNFTGNHAEHGLFLFRVCTLLCL